MRLVVLAMLFFACQKPCEELTEQCECWKAAPRCQLVNEPCWCPSVCDPAIACVCGGGKFLRCEARGENPGDGGS